MARLLLDECVDRRLKRHIVGHEVRTASELGWAGQTDRQMLDRAEGLFDAIITVDRNLAFQQHLHGRSFAILVLRAASNRLADLVPAVPNLLLAIDDMRPGTATDITA